ncbi:MAG: FAD-binding and (Fe-S)-binding domain-containing protein [Nocardioidaceae bacterium]|nr:FAD-binding and (Fe-S)-binding domain-containing protein [Nocardioidaceae bacterium]
MATLTSAPSGTDLGRALRAAGIAEVLTDGTNRAAYSSDASLYRVVPQAVVRPRDAEEVARVLAVSRELGVPVTARGAGTSVAGNAVGDGVVLDFSRHMNQVLGVDREARTARVQPGTVHAALMGRATPEGLRFGPDPSTHTRCTIGGMIGNNACGARTLGYGRTSDNVAALDVVTGTGALLTATAPAGGTPTVIGADTQVDALRALVGDHLGVIRTELGRFGRQVSGYSLEHLLPEHGFDLTRALVGSEGTLGIVTEATVRLVADPRHRLLVVLGFDDMPTAGDMAPRILEHGPSACEGLDSRIVDVVRERLGESALPVLPDGRAWLLTEVSGDDEDDVRARAEAMVAQVPARAAEIVDDPRRAATLWRVREDGAGLAGRAPSGRPAHAGWEDTAVPPERLGDYLRDFEVLLGEHDLSAMPYGHFGDGCMHVRLDYPLDKPNGAAAFRSFLEAAADLVAGYGGSLSGEHGDGRARSELLPRMYSPEMIGLFKAVKHVMDPDGLLNPGVLVDPEPLDARLRVPAAPPLRRNLAFAYEHDGGDLGQAVHRCTGVGKCRADLTAGGGVMCPSFLATREEKDSTRGRARVLQEMVNGSDVKGWRSPEVHEALDLCLSCKGCASDCPTGIDMATYKAEVLHQSYKRRLRPRSHYALGWLPRWARLVTRFRLASLVNAAIRLPGLGRVGLWAAGVDHRRSVPAFAQRSFRDWFASTASERSTTGKPVLLFVDSFTDHFSPEVGQAMVRVLEDAGWSPTLTPRPTCCGLTWITTGQLDGARRILRETVDALLPAAAEGTPIVGIEPSCTGVLRSDAVELLGDDASRSVASATRTLAELLATDDAWTPPSLAGTQVVAQPHCHHHAVMGWSPDAKLLESAGADVQRLGGCCGLAGNFGVEIGHHEVSVAVAEHQLLPAVRDAGPDAVVLADGFSCRTQLDDLSDRSGIHLAQLLDPMRER